MPDLPTYLELKRLPNSPYHPRGTWTVACAMPGCKTGFRAQGGDREDIESKALVHDRNEHWRET